MKIKKGNNKIVFGEQTFIISDFKGKEIGSFFEFPELEFKINNNAAYNDLVNCYKNFVFLGDGRQAIKAVLLNINDNKRKSYLPAYICHSIIQPFHELKFNVEFYGHESHLKQILSGIEIKNSIIFIVDYFGTEFISNNEIYEFLDNENIVILDVSHSFFNKNRFLIKHDNFYIISSLRKMFPIPDGGVVYYNNPEFEVIQSYSSDYEKMLEAMLLKYYYLNNNSRLRVDLSELKKDFLFFYKNYEEKKDQLINLHNISNISLYILKNSLMSNIIEKRLGNLKFLYENINLENFLFDFDEIKSPFFLPLIFENRQKRNKIKNLLAENGVYAPVHWDVKNVSPSMYHYEHELSEKILSIPIDQRYELDDMSRICDILNNTNI